MRVTSGRDEQLAASGISPRIARPRVTRTRLVVALAVALVLLVAAFVYVLYGNYEVVSKNRLTYEIELFDRFTITADVESRPRKSTLNGFLLMAIASIALFVATFLHTIPSPPVRFYRFFFLASAGAAWLAIDEAMGVHETLGHNMDFLADIPGVSRPDDVIFALYGVPALVFAVLFRDVIFSSRKAVFFFGVAALIFLMAAGFDFLTVGLEETIEPVSTLCILAGIVVLALEQLSRAFAARATASSETS